MKSIPKGWVKTKLVDIATVQTGLSKSAARQGEFVSRPYLRVANVQDGHLDLSEVKYIDVPVAQQERFRLVSGDILLTEGGDFDKLGRGCLWQGEIEDCVHQNHVFAVRVKESSLLTPVFLALLIQSDRSRAYFVSCAKQTTNLASINSSQLKQLPVLLPPITEQDEILRMIDECSRGIHTAAALLDALERRKQGLMQQLLAGRRRLKGFKGKWKTYRLGQLFAERNESNRPGLPLLSISRGEGIIPRDDSGRIDTSNEDKSAYLRICPGDIGYNTMRMWQGVSALSSLEGIVSPAYTVCTPTELSDTRFMAHLFKLPRTINLFYRYSQGLTSDTWNLKFHHFSKIKVQVPQRDEQAAIANVLDEQDTELLALAKQLEQLKTQKRALMQKLLSGEWRLPASPAQGKSSSKKGLQPPTVVRKQLSKQ